MSINNLLNVQKIFMSAAQSGPDEFDKNLILNIFISVIFLALLIIILQIINSSKKRLEADYAELLKAKEKETRQRENLEKLIKSNTQELYEKNLSLQKTNEEIVELLGNVVEMRDADSGQHIKRVKTFSYILAQQVMKDCPEYGLTMEDVEIISSVSALHDVGKIMIPDSILLKPGALTDEEFDLIKTHCVKGCEILKNAPKTWEEKYIKTAMDIVHYHHEKWDGKGYPEGLSGDDIPISAQIVSVADVYDALAFERVYKKAFDAKKVFEMIKNGECGAFSDKLIRCLERCDSRFVSSIADFGEEDNMDEIVSIGENALHGVKILLVDDSDIIRNMNSGILQNEGAVVVEAKNGAEAIEEFSRNNKYDMILMDILMPEIDGIRATRSIRNLETNGNRIPIIALTAEATDAEINACLNAGADDCIQKPMKISQLVKMMQRYGKNK